MIYRPDCIKAIEPFIDQPLVKVLPGVRRCGKSTILEMLKRELISRGIAEDHIITKRYTEMDIPENTTAKQMYDEFSAEIECKGRCYLLLDEIQEIEGWEKAIKGSLPEICRHTERHGCRNRERYSDRPSQGLSAF